MAYPKREDVPANTARKPMRGVKVDDELIIKALTKYNGNISRAADYIGCNRSTIQRRVNDDLNVKDVYESLRERDIDITEDVFRDKILSGDTSCVLFALKTRGRKRGYDSERDVIVESATRGVLDFIVNRSKNPAES